MERLGKYDLLMQEGTIILSLFNILLLELKVKVISHLRK